MNSTGLLSAQTAGLPGYRKYDWLKARHQEQQNRVWHAAQQPFALAVETFKAELRAIIEPSHPVASVTGDANAYGTHLTVSLVGSTRWRWPEIVVYLPGNLRERGTAHVQIRTDNHEYIRRMQLPKQFTAASVWRRVAHYFENVRRTPLLPPLPAPSTNPFIHQSTHP